MGRYPGKANPVGISVTDRFSVACRVLVLVTFSASENCRDCDPVYDPIMSCPRNTRYFGDRTLKTNRNEKLDKSNQLCYNIRMQSCRFSFAVHVMAVLALQKADCCPSSRLAQTVNTNPVVIRRILIELQEAGLISTLRGPHGGALLNRKPEKVTLREIHDAVDQRNTFGTHPKKPSPECPVGKKITTVMQQIQDRANRALARELEKMTLADVLRELRRG
jgi:Rrf2 family protein